MSDISIKDSAARRRIEFIFAGLFAVFPLGMATVNHYASTIAALMVILGIVLGFMGDNRPSRGQWYLVLGVVVLLIAALLSFSNVDDMHQSKKRYMILVKFIGFLPLFYGMVNCRHNLATWFMTGVLIAGPLNLGVGLHSMWIQGFTRAQGYYNPIILGDLSMVAAMLVLVSLFISPAGHSTQKKIWMWFVLFCFVLTSLLSGTRGALVAIPPVVLFLLWIFRGQMSMKNVKRIAIPLALGAISLILFWLLNDSGIEMFQRGTDSKGFWGNPRIVMWIHSMQIFVEHPFVGAGLGDFEAELIKLREAGPVDLSKNYAHAHSIFIGHLAMTGIIGLVSMVLAVFIIPAMVIVKSMRGRWQQPYCGVEALIVLICFAAFGLTEQWLARSVLAGSFVVFLVAFFPRKDKADN